MSTKAAKQAKSKGRARTAAKAAPRPDARKAARGNPQTRTQPAKTARKPAAVAKTGTLVRADAQDFMTQLDRWFERSFGRMMSPTLGLPGSLFEDIGRSIEARMPRVDVLNRDNDVLVRAELPGIDKKDVQVALTGRTLTIRAETGTQKRRRQGEYFHQEISHRAYERTIGLPGGIDVDRARASLDHGVLEVAIPKTEGAAKSPIDIQ
ncbi:MAG: Hsp20/alpha crystallin family protein [Betaproteobacteria bacterium]|nr:MAG: Hsp20/alpha crystallin family protein [Betaproteobacteria bacterium]